MSYVFSANLLAISLPDLYLIVGFNHNDSNTLIKPRVHLSKAAGIQPPPGLKIRTHTYIFFLYNI